MDTQKFLCEESSDDDFDSEPVLNTIDGTDGPTVATTSSDTDFQETTEVPRTTGDSGSTNENEQQQFSNVFRRSIPRWRSDSKWKSHYETKSF